MGDAAGQERVCGVCLNHCNYESKGSGFSTYVWEDFENTGVVPCNERVRFNNMTGEEVTFVANKRTKVSQGSHTEHNVWERLEEVLCTQ